jgi:hypothetical protein
VTDPVGVFWTKKPGTYLQPRVINPPDAQNAENARFAIHHIGRKFEIEVYPTAQGWRAGNADLTDDGRHDPGVPRIVTVFGAIQPQSSGGAHSVQQNFEGERTEASIVVHLDSHQEFNIAAAKANADIFPDGIRIIGPDDDSAADDRFNHAMIIRWRGRRWKVLETLDLFEAGQEELHPAQAIYRAVCGLYQNRSHERNATPQNFDPEWGPA